MPNHLANASSGWHGIRPPVTCQPFGKSSADMRALALPRVPPPPQRVLIGGPTAGVGNLTLKPWRVRVARQHAIRRGQGKALLSSAAPPQRRLAAGAIVGPHPADRV
jgi:hypothetical protein